MTLLAADSSRLVAITCAPAAALAAGERSFVGRVPIDLPRARAQHAAYCDWLKASGAELLQLEAEESLPDSVFVEDTAIVLPELAILAVPGAPSRREEPHRIEPLLTKFCDCQHLPPNARLDGGDVLVRGRLICVGLSARTNHVALTALRSLLEPLGYEVRGVAVRGCLHLKTACTALDEHTLLLNPDWLQIGELGDADLIRVDPAEPFAANTLRVRDAIAVSASYPRTLEKLNLAGWSVQPLSIDEFHKAEAGLTCMSLVFSSGKDSAALRSAVQA